MPTPRRPLDCASPLPSRSISPPPAAAPATGRSPGALVADTFQLLGPLLPAWRQATPPPPPRRSPTPMPPSPRPAPSPARSPAPQDPSLSAEEAAGRHASELVGERSRSAHRACRAQLAAFSAKKQRQLVAMCQQMGGEGRDRAGEGTVAWLRAIATSDFRLSLHLTEAFTAGDIGGISLPLFRQMQAVLSRTPPDRQSGCVRDSSRLAALGRPSQEAGRGGSMLHMMTLLAKEPAARAQDALARFLLGWLPAGKLGSRQLERATTWMAGLDAHGRQLLAEGLGDVLAEAGVSNKQTARLFGVLAGLAEEPERRRAHLSALRDPLLRAPLSRLAPRDQMRTVTSLLRLRGDMRAVAPLLLGVGGERMGPRAVGHHEVIDAVVGLEPDRDVAHARRFVDAAQGLCRVVPGPVQGAFLRLLARAAGDEIPQVGAHMRSLVSFVLAPAAARRPAAVTPERLRQWVERLAARQGAPRAVLWGACVSARTQAACDGLGGPVLLAVFDELMRLEPEEVSHADPLVDAARALADSWHDQVPALVCALRWGRAPVMNGGLSAVVAFCLPFCRQAVGPDLAPLVGSLCQLRVTQRAPFLAACAPLLASNVPDEVAGYLFEYCARGHYGDDTRDDADDDADDADDLSPWARRVERCLNFYPAMLADQENVMSGGRIARARLAILALRERFGASTPAERQLSRFAIITYVARWRSSYAQSPARAALEAEWGGDIAINHAHRMLHGRGAERPAAQGAVLADCGRQRSLALAGEPDVSMDELAHWVWRAIDAHPGPRGGSAAERAKEQDNMRYSFMLALAHCIHHEDGHIVCSVGISQRLLQVMQGYDRDTHIDAATPAQLLTTLGRTFCQRVGDAPSEAQKATFRDEAAAAAARLYTAHSPEMRAFTADLDTWLRML